MRCNCNYADTVTLSGRDDVAEFYDYRGFRYIEILNAPIRPQVWVDVRHYPFDAGASDFECSEPLLGEIWTISKHGVRLGSQDVFVDCPTREKGQYTGDTYMTVLSQLILTGDPALTRKAIRDFQLTQRFDPGLLAVKVHFPTVAGPIVAEYEKGNGYCLTVPEGVEVQVARTEGIHFTIKHA